MAVDVGQLVAGEFGDQARLGGQKHPQRVTVIGRVQRDRLDAGRVQLVHTPQQPVDRRGALALRVFAAIHQQLQLQRRLVVRGDRQPAVR